MKSAGYKKIKITVKIQTWIAITVFWQSSLKKHMKIERSFYIILS
jgi:hypothetical protein